jgi:hypothetical protein
MAWQGRAGRSHFARLLRRYQRIAARLNFERRRFGILMALQPPSTEPECIGMQIKRSSTQLDADPLRLTAWGASAIGAWYELYSKTKQDPLKSAKTSQESQDSSILTRVPNREGAMPRGRPPARTLTRDPRIRNPCALWNCAKGASFQK